MKHLKAMEEQGNDLASLSQAWSERVKNLRQLEKRNESTDFADDLAESLPEDSELFAGTVHEDLSAQDIFVGDENFYKSMGTSRFADSDVKLSSSSSRKAESKKQSLLMSKILIVSIILMILAVLSYSVLTLSSSDVFNPSQKAVAGAPQAEAVRVETDNSSQNQEPEPTFSPDHPLSLKTAQNDYMNGDYSQACFVFGRLVKNLHQGPDQDATRDFLRLNMALCLRKSGRSEQSMDLLKEVSVSKSAAVNILANYYLCLFERDEKQFLDMRMRAYRVISLLDVIDSATDWSRRLRRNSYFLAAEAVTREALFLADADRELPRKLWPYFDDESIPFTGLSEDEIERILSDGSQQLNKALLGPKIQRENRDGVSYWTINCNGASFEELVNRFSANAGYDVCWEAGSDHAGSSGRPVTVYLAATSDRQLVTAAAGCAGLLASFNKDNVISLYNPAKYSRVSEQQTLLDAEAISCWQRYLLTFYEDVYLANAHFAMGLLKGLQGLTVEALAEYKTVPSRYSSSDLGSAALVCSAKLKTGLRDYEGAYCDLKEATEQYPESDKIDQIYLDLAAAAEKTDRNDEAAKLYGKVYYLNSSPQSQSAAALAAGTNFYHNQNYADAEKWLSRFVNLAEKDGDQDLYRGCLLLGKTWLALKNDASACEALQAALAGWLSRKDYMETVASLVEGYLRQKRFVEALQVLDSTSSRQFLQTESVQILLLRSRALRGIGLTDKAVTLLADRQEYVVDDLLKAQIGYELSECYIEQGQLNLAYRELTDVLEKAGTGSVAYQAAYKLTDVCLQLGLDDQALSVGSQLLNQHPGEAIEQKTLKLVAATYQKKKNYDKAALALMGQWK